MTIKLLRVYAKFCLMTLPVKAIQRRKNLTRSIKFVWQNMCLQTCYNYKSSVCIISERIINGPRTLPLNANTHATRHAIKLRLVSQ